MNPQPPIYIGQLCATLFVIGLIYHVIKAYHQTTTPINYDLFQIGYIEDSPINIVVDKSTSNNFESHQLYLDCIDALHALGMKKSIAKKKAKEVFTAMQNDPPKNVQDFLMIALRNN